MIPSKLKATILDGNSFDRGDIDLSPLQLESISWAQYDNTLKSEISQRVSGCEIVITNKIVLDRRNIAKLQNSKANSHCCNKYG